MLFPFQFFEEFLDLAYSDLQMLQRIAIGNTDVSFAPAAKSRTGNHGDPFLPQQALTELLAAQTSEDNPVPRISGNT